MGTVVYKYLQLITSYRTDTSNLFSSPNLYSCISPLPHSTWNSTVYTIHICLAHMLRIFHLRLSRKCNIFRRHRTKYIGMDSTNSSKKCGSACIILPSHANL